jgi:hypothetical protein
MTPCSKFPFPEIIVNTNLANNKNIIKFAYLN